MNVEVVIELIKDFKQVILHNIGQITVLMYLVWQAYKHIGFFATRKFPKAKNNHKYAIMIAARNEEAVIGNLIESIKAQDYPAELVTVFVVADNCTDKTAEVARNLGAVCYERFDNEHRTKGYALEFLVDNIKKDYGVESFDAFFIFDADNLLKKDYLARMNEAFDSGEKIVTSYRNTKNFDDNWLAACYGIHWLRTIRREHRARSVLNIATRIQGTGFMFASEIIKDGWHYVSFTEDRAFSADAVVNGYRISYCDAAEFYDEQPTSVRIAMRQRIRWSKGHLQAFVESGPKLLGRMIVPKKVNPQYPDPSPETENYTHLDGSIPDIFDDIKAFMLNALHFSISSKRKNCGKFGRFISVLGDVVLFPFRMVAVAVSAVLCVCGFVICNVLKAIGWLFCLIKKNFIVKKVCRSRIFKNLKMRFMSYDMFLITFPNNLVTLLRRWLNVFGGVALFCLGVRFYSHFFGPFWAYFLTFVTRYRNNLILPVYVFFIERKRIIKIPLWKKVFYCIMWPIFDIMGSVSMLIALFSKVEWKPIPHKSDVSIDALSKELAGKK